MRHNPEVILLQETKCEGSKERAILEKWLKNWSFCSIESEGILGGILTGWSPSYKSISSSTFNSTILVKLESKHLSEPLTILNIYGPCVDHIPFFEGLASSGAFGDPLTFISRDLNFS
jgi:hypothetical protein